MLQSHALHFFHLSSPDLLFGFSSPVAQRHVVGVANAHPEIAKKGILLRKFGQEIIRITSGKRVHGTGAVPGGVNKLVTAQERDTLKQELPQMLQWARDSVDITKQLHAQSDVLYREFGSFRSNLMSLVRADGAMDLYDGVLRVRDANGLVLFDGVDDQKYLDLIEEEVRSWSYMKFPHLRSLGRELGWYRVGPLARVQNCDFIPSPLAEIERKEFVAWGQGELVHASLAYHWARMIEMLHAVEVIAQILDDPALLSGEMMSHGVRQRGGVGIIEAPRGTLIHDYEVGDDDLVTRCNLIVSTTHNNQAMNEAVRSVAKEYINGQEISEGLLNHIEVAIRAYDPCLSCATHALGQMPLDVTLVAADGTVLDRVQKSPSQGLTRQIDGAIGLEA
jgi:NAD-reducing hydrogenase large subunit